MLCMSPKPPLPITPRELSRRQSTHSLMMSSFFLTQRTCAVHGNFEGRMIPRSFELLISSLTIKISCGEKRRCFSATGVQDSSMSGSESSPSTHTGTRLGQLEIVHLQ